MLPNRISTASQGRSKFATKAQVTQIQKQGSGCDTLPKLTGTLGMTQNSIEHEDGAVSVPPEVQEKMSRNQRLIKTSHIKQRSKMAIGEIDDGSQIVSLHNDEDATAEANLKTKTSCVSPTLPSTQANNKPAGASRLQNGQMPARTIRNKTLKK